MYIECLEVNNIFKEAKGNNDKRKYIIKICKDKKFSWLILKINLLFQIEKIPCKFYTLG